MRDRGDEVVLHALGAADLISNSYFVKSIVDPVLKINNIAK